MKLHDFKYDESPVLNYNAKAQEIKAWLNRVAKVPDNKFTFNQDLSVDVHQNVFIAGKGLTNLPVQFNRVEGTFSCASNKLTSLKGAPRYVGGRFDAAGNQIESLSFVPAHIGARGHSSGYCFLANNQITSLHGIHKHIKELNGSLILGGNRVQSHVLGVLLIKGIEEVMFLNGEKVAGMALSEVEDIMNKHLHRGRDINLCQEELIDAGLVEYAKL